MVRAMSQCLIHPLIVMSLDCSVGCWKVLFHEVSLLQHMYGLDGGSLLDLVGDQFQFFQVKVWVHICLIGNLIISATCMTWSGCDSRLCAEWRVMLSTMVMMEAKIYFQVGWA